MHIDNGTTALIVCRTRGAVLRVMRYLQCHFAIPSRAKGVHYLVDTFNPSVRYDDDSAIGVGGDDEKIMHFRGTGGVDYAVRWETVTRGVTKAGPRVYHRPPTGEQVMDVTQDDWDRFHECEDEAEEADAPTRVEVEGYEQDGAGSWKAGASAAAAGGGSTAAAGSSAGEEAEWRSTRPCRSGAVLKEVRRQDDEEGFFARLAVEPRAPPASGAGETRPGDSDLDLADSEATSLEA